MCFRHLNLPLQISAILKMELQINQNSLTLFIFLIFFKTQKIRHLFCALNVFEASELAASEGRKLPIKVSFKYLFLCNLMVFKYLIPWRYFAASWTKIKTKMWIKRGKFLEILFKSHNTGNVNCKKAQYFNWNLPPIVSEILPLFLEFQWKHLIFLGAFRRLFLVLNFLKN